MSILITRLRSSRYFHALAILTSGSVLGGLIIAVHQILQTRIFTAEDIGVYTFLLAVPSMFISVMSLRFDIAIVTEKEERNVFALVKLSIVLIILLSVLITVFYVFYILILNDNYIEYLYIIPFIFLMLVGYGLYNTISSYNNRCKEYKLLFNMYVLRTFIQSGGVLFFGFFLVKLAGLKELSILVMIVPYSTGLFAGIIRQSKTLWVHKDEIKSITKNEMFEVAQIHKNQAFISTPALFVNSFSFSIITIIIEKLYDTIVLGYYSVTNRILGMPIAIVAGNVAKVFIVQASCEYNETGRFIKAFKQSVMFLVAIAIVMFLSMFFLAPPLCEIVFGKGWGVSGEYMKILAPMFSFRLVCTALSQGLVICKKQKTELFFNILLTISSVGSGLITWVFQGDIKIFLTILSTSRTICYLWMTLVIYTYAKGNISKKKIIQKRMKKID